MEKLNLIKKWAQCWGLILSETAALISGMVILLFTPAVFSQYYPLLHPSARHSDAVSIVTWLHSDRPEFDLNIPMKAGLLNEKEKSHYADVRIIVQTLPLIFMISTSLLTILTLLNIKGNFFRDTQLRALALNLCLFCLASLWSVIHWESLFAAIHNPLFGTTLWQLSTTDYSLNLFPMRFWQTLFGVVSMTLIMSLGLLYSIALIMTKMQHRRTPSEHDET